ncbi:MAG: LCP family protein [Lachnospiraceae bacterium]|nr:LCP family protein [Lachnospiraceae bacterium]
MKKAVKVLAGLGIALLVFAAAVLLLFAGLRARGKKAMQEVVSGVEIPPIDLGSVSAASADTIAWEPEEEPLREGEILYEGKRYRYRDDMICMLLMGIDKKGKLGGAGNALDGGQADALFLLVLDPQKKEYTILTINRNTMAEVDVFREDGSYEGLKIAQLALQHGYGDGLEESCLRQIKAVSRFLHNVPVNSYVALNIAAVPELNDAVGGVPVVLAEDMRLDGVTHAAGEEVLLDGKQAVEYVQQRDVNVFDSNSERQQRQKQYMTGFVSKLREGARRDPGLTLELYRIARDYMVTDIDISRVTYMTSEFLSYHMSEAGIRSIPGEVRQGELLEEFYADDEAVKDLIVELFYDEVE